MSIWNGTAREEPIKAAADAASLNRAKQSEMAMTEPQEARVRVPVDRAVIGAGTPASASGDEPHRDAAASQIPIIVLAATSQRPALVLFREKDDAGARAREIGAPWVPVAYACGYLLTNGWSFCDACGIVQSFCLVPVDALPMIRALVTELPALKISAKQWTRVIHENLRGEASLTDLSQPLFEAVCRCTLMRSGYPPPTGEKSDWLTDPPWALKLPTRRRSVVIRMKG